MIKNRPAKGFNRGVRITRGLILRGEKPVQLLKKRIFLHVAPCVGETRNRKLNQREYSNNVIKTEHIINITSRPVAVTKRADKIKIANQDPVLCGQNKIKIA